MHIQAVNLRVKDVEQSSQYYQDVLGFEQDFRHGGDDGKVMYASLKWGEAQVMLSSLEDVAEAARPFTGAGVDILFNLEDRDIDAYYDQFKQKGAKILAEIEEKFWGHREFMIEDPDGYRLVFTKHVKDVDFSQWQQGAWSES